MIPKKSKKRVGLPPGSIVFTGSQRVEKIQIHHLKYNAKTVEDVKLDNHSTIVFEQPSAKMINWYDVRGIHDTALVEQLGKQFELHPLILEDIVDTQQRPKFEEYEKGVFLILKALSFNKIDKKVITEQIGVYFKNGCVITFQEDHTDIFEAVRQRLIIGKGKVRHKAADYLAYALVDNVVDNYFTILDEIAIEIENLEDDLLDKPSHRTKESIHQLKKENIRIRKSVAPLREAISRFSKSESPFIDANTDIFLRDLYDHTIQIVDMVDTNREILNGLQDLYISEISFKMNQIIQVLTIITTIFVPLSFLVGLYGMNFDNMPELHYKYGYFVLLGVMLTLAVSLLFWFRKQRWI